MVIDRFSAEATLRDRKRACSVEFVAGTFMVSYGSAYKYLRIFYTIIDLMLSIILAIKSIVSSMLVMNSVVVV